MDNLDDFVEGVQNSSGGGSGMESPTELVSSTIHGFPEVKTLLTACAAEEQQQQQALFVLAAPPPPPLLQQQQQQQQHSSSSSSGADLYALTLSDGSVVHFKIENNTNAIQGEAATMMIFFDTLLSAESFTKITTGWGGHLFRRFCNMFSKKFPLLAWAE